MDYYNYNTTSYVNSDASFGIGAALGAFLAAYVIVVIAIAVFEIIVMWKVFAKAGKPGWAAIIPVYNIIVLLQVAKMHWAWIFLLLAAIIPFIGWMGSLALCIMMYIKIAKNFGKSGGFAAGLILLNPIFMAILAFDKSEYKPVEG